MDMEETPFYRPLSFGRLWGWLVGPLTMIMSMDRRGGGAGKGSPIKEARHRTDAVCRMFKRRHV